MTIKTILAPINTAETSRSTLEVAMILARRFGAHIDALHVQADPRGLVPYTGEGMDGSMIEEIMEVTEREGSERATKSKEFFDEFCSQNGLVVTDQPNAGQSATISWNTEIGREDEVVALLGRLYDLIVVGRSVRDAPLPSPITLEAALLDTGRPIVVAPPEALPDVGSKIAVAWEASPETGRAVADAMPLLEGAGSVVLLAPEQGQVAPIAAEEMVTRLAWHGVDATIQRFDASLTELGAAFLSEADKINADLLVKGAYSQSRLRQMILGGRTRHILARTKIPVLLSH